MTQPAMDRTIRQFVEAKMEYKNLQVHQAESKWQFCDCGSCQDYRHLILSQPGSPIDFKTYRKKDERY